MKKVQFKYQIVNNLITSKSIIMTQNKLLAKEHTGDNKNTLIRKNLKAKMSHFKTMVIHIVDRVDDTHPQENLLIQLKNKSNSTQIKNNLDKKKKIVYNLHLNCMKMYTIKIK